MPAMPEDSPFVEGFTNMFEAFAAAVKNYGDCDEYADKIARWSKQKLMTQFIDIAEPMQCGFQILNHGDLWLNNMMFKSDEDNNALDVSMIDFQGPFWASPTSDLFYFLMTSVADDIKIDQFDHLIKFYHERLTDALKKLKYDQNVPALEELHADLLDKGYFR